MIYKDQQQGMNKQINDILNKEIKDPYSTARKERLEDKRLHFTDANEDLRKAFIDQFLFTHKGFTYVFFKSESLNGTYKELYLKLLAVALKSLYKTYDNAKLNIFIECNDKIKIKEIKKCSKNIEDFLRKNGSSCAIIKNIAMKSKKDEPCFSIPDFMLAVLGKYLKDSKDSKRDRYNNFFEKLRSKYKFIYNLDNNKRFHRKGELEVREIFNNP